MAKKSHLLKQLKSIRVTPAFRPVLPMGLDLMEVSEHCLVCSTKWWLDINVVRRV